jgi:DNA-binding NarL/FixJ family response regulator
MEVWARVDENSHGPWLGAFCSRPAVAGSVPATAQRWRVKSVIVVDDHALVRFAIKHILQREMLYRVLGECASGDEAWAMMQDEQPDLLIVDLDIPGIAGLDLVGRVRARFPETKMLVVSAQNERIYADRARREGAHGFVSKTRDFASIALACATVGSGYLFFPIASSSGGGATQSLDALSKRELIIIRHLLAGKSNMQIAQSMFVSNKTVSGHKMNIFRKLGVTSLIELARLAKTLDL